MSRLQKLMWRLFLMLLYNARKSDSGFTLIEMMVTTIIIGVIAAIAAPNFLGLLNRNRVNEAARQIEGALTEAQRQAMRRGTQCSISVDLPDNTISNPAGGNGCLLNNRILNDLVELNTNRATITFSGKGNIEIDDLTPGSITPTPVLVVSMTNGTDLQRCIVIDSLLGSQRLGEYSGTIPDPPVDTSCQ